MTCIWTIQEGHRRRAVSVPMLAVSSTTLIGVAALTIDVGSLLRAREESQIAADSAALAGAMELLDRDKLSGTPDMTEEIIAARQAALNYAARNEVINAAPELDPDQDVEVGYMEDLNFPNAALAFDDPNLFNTVMVRVHGSVAMSFASIFGIHMSQAGAMGAATYKDGVVGFRVTPDSGPAGLMPFALHIDAWEGLLADTWTSSDSWAYDPDTDSVGSGSDNIRELNLYPGAGTDQLPPGNFGTVDIGSSNNSTAVIERQILYGITAEDLEWHGGELVLNADGELFVEGDTGLSAGIKDELEAIIGEPRTILLFNHVEGPGNNAVYTIVGFAGIRVMYVKLTGAMHTKKLLIQPEFVTDDAAITDAGPGQSYFVLQPVLLTR